MRANRLTAVDAQMFWMSSRMPNDTFLLYGFDGVPADLPAALGELAAQARHDAIAAADAVAERASVLVAGPLGLCYLPAFLCLGVIPVVAGLAGDVLGSGLL